MFEIIINSDRTATYNAIKYNFPNGHFVGTVDPRTYSGLISLLNYTDFPYLKEHYSVDWTDSQSCTLTIAFDNGNTKKIYCYGPAGTYGLGRVYGLIYKLRRDQAWK